MPVVPPPQQPIAPDLVADTTREYVSSGGGWSWFGSAFFRALPTYIDDITADFGDDLYDRMMNDPQVAANINYVKLAILAYGVRLVNPLPVKDPDYKKAEDIRAFCQRNLDNLDRPFVGTLFEMLDSLIFGHKVAEIIYYQCIEGEDAGKMCLSKLKVKSRKATAMVVDAFGNVVAILGILPSQGLTSIISAGFIGVMGQGGAVVPSNLLPRGKFMIMTNRPKDSDPRGTSILRPAYNAWWFKMQIWPEYLKYLAQFAVASLLGFTPEGAVTVPRSQDPDSNVGDATPVSPEQNMATVLEAMKGGSVGVFPYGSVVQPVEVNERGEVFIQALDMCNREITKAVLHQTRATMEAQHESHSGTDGGLDVANTVVDQGKLMTAAMVKTDLLTPLVLLNYGESARRLVPNTSLSSVAVKDLASNGMALASLINSQYFDLESQVTGLDAQYNFPERDIVGWLKRRVEPPGHQLVKPDPQPGPGRPSMDMGYQLDEGQ